MGALVISNTLLEWEKKIRRDLETISPSKRAKAAGLLPLVPSLVDWDEFTGAVRTEWEAWKRDLLRYPTCLLMLYSGIAFYEYDENKFWPQFAEIVGRATLPANRQQEINGEFADAAKLFGLAVKGRGHGTDFVGSAVQYIGVPLSLWDGFLSMCEWALWRKDWKSLSDDEWAEAVHKRSGSRRRLKNFLTYNRELASDLIQDLLDVREILAADKEITLEGITQASVLRVEYFDEVPETADFLRPGNPDSLFQGRARIVWNERRSRISVQVPAVARDKLPATWHVGGRSHLAGLSPDELPLNTLKSSSGSETQRLRGFRSWGLFDIDSGGRFVNPNRDELPLKSYVVISLDEIENVVRSGFEEEDYPANERFELADGSTCFITRLCPIGKHAELRIKPRTETQRTLSFRPSAKIEARFFVGWGHKAAFFSRTRERQIIMGHLPVLCVAIPNGYFNENNAELERRFKVLIDGKPTSGQWEFRDQQAAIDSRFYFWRWDKKPLIERKPGVSKLTGFGQLIGAFKSPDLRGEHTFAIEALPHIQVEFRAAIVDRPSIGLESCWDNFPGVYLPLLLVCQSPSGMKWEDLLLAKDIISPGSVLSPYLLHKYAQHGILLLRGHRWEISESPAEIAVVDRNTSRLKFCGDPSKLWGLYKEMSQKARHKMLPKIEVKNNRGEVPYLEMNWPRYLCSAIENYFQHNEVFLKPIL